MEENYPSFEDRRRVEENQVSLNIMEILFLLLSRWKVLLLAAVICAAIAGAYNEFFIDPIYTAQAELYLPYNNAILDVAEVTLSNNIRGDYDRILLSRTVLKRVIADQKLDTTPGALKGMISLYTPDNSHCMVVSVTSGSPEQSIGIVNSLLRFGIDQIYRIIGKDEPGVIDSAESDAITSYKPSRNKYMLIGALVGAAAVAAIYIIIYMTDMTIKSEGDVERYLGLPVVSAVSVFAKGDDHNDMSSGSKSKKRKGKSKKESKKKKKSSDGETSV